MGLGETYGVRTFCKNCGDAKNTILEKGKLVEGTQCSKCGNMSLVRDKRTEGERLAEEAHQEKLLRAHRGW